VIQWSRFRWRRVTVEGRTWVLDLPPGTPLLTANQRLHHMAQYRIIQNLQEVIGWLVRQKRVPHLESAHITYVLRVPDMRRRDPGNWAPTAKALVDGLVHAGVFDDDDFTRVTGPYPAVVTGAPVLSLSLVIRDTGGG